VNKTVYVDRWQPACYVNDWEIRGFSSQWGFATGDMPDLRVKKNHNPPNKNEKNHTRGSPVK